MTATDQAKDAIEQLTAGLQAHGYVCDRAIATVLHLARTLDKPILVEGPPGVGKTELARAASAHLALPLIRLQCYEGLDETKALYEWKYGKQLLYTQILREKLGELLEGTQGLDQAMERLHRYGDGFFSERFLEPRPLLKALQTEGGSVLLVDEVDKADQEFEAFLLEILSDHQVSIPEIGTVTAAQPPLTVLTSNSTREISEALRRRCLYLHIDFPEAERERLIVDTRVPGIGEALRSQLVAFVHGLRELELRKAPAVSETVDWARTLLLLNAQDLDTEVVQQTLNVLLKHQDDAARVTSALPDLLAQSRRAG